MTMTINETLRRITPLRGSNRNYIKFIDGMENNPYIFKDLQAYDNIPIKQQLQYFNGKYKPYQLRILNGIAGGKGKIQNIFLKAKYTPSISYMCSLLIHNLYDLRDKHAEDDSIPLLRHFKNLDWLNEVERNTNIIIYEMEGHIMTFEAIIRLLTILDKSNLALQYMQKLDELKAKDFYFY